MLLLLSLMTLIFPVWTDKDLQSCTDLYCFHQSEEKCPKVEDSQPRCRILPECRVAVVCCHLNDDNIEDELKSLGLESNRNITALHIRNATLRTLNLKKSHWRHLRSFSVTDGHIERIGYGFPRHTGISCLNLSSNGIIDFYNNSLGNMYNLTMLDLSHNNLTYVPLLRANGNITLDLSDNKPLLCISVVQTRSNRSGLNFINEKDSFCSSSSSFHWFNITERLSLSEVERIYELKDNCTIKNCNCTPHRLEFSPGQMSTFALKVDCAGKQLTALPSPLPSNTIALNVSNNNISSLDPISDDPSYESLRELYADNNTIASILPLEGSRFINQFVFLSLRYNKLKTVPTYVLSNIFDRNYKSRYIYLGQNRLECDCNTAKVLKVWLLTKQKHVPDNEEIYCENMAFKVLDLDPSKLCQTQQDWTDYIYYIITTEVLLLVSLIAKVSYDYWVFKTAGYLPWPASKMPKLPCDWLCE